MHLGGASHTYGTVSVALAAVVGASVVALLPGVMLTPSQPLPSVKLCICAVTFGSSVFQLTSTVIFALRCGYEMAVLRAATSTDTLKFGHRAVLQSCSSIREGQAVPPFAAVTCTGRERDRLPTSQLLEHATHGSHVPTTQLRGQ